MCLFEECVRSDRGWACVRPYQLTLACLPPLHQPPAAAAEGKLMDLPHPRDRNGKVGCALFLRQLPLACAVCVDGEPGRISHSLPSLTPAADSLHVAEPCTHAPGRWRALATPRTAWNQRWMTTAAHVMRPARRCGRSCASWPATCRQVGLDTWAGWQATSGQDC